MLRLFKKCKIGVCTRVDVSSDMVSETLIRNQRLIQHYAKLVESCMSFSGKILADWKPTWDMIRLVRNLSERLNTWNDQSSSCEAYQVQAAAQSFKTILQYCEQILDLIDKKIIDETVMVFDYEDKRSGVTHHRLRDVIQTQHSEMLGGNTKEAVYAELKQASQKADIAQSERTRKKATEEAARAERAKALDRLKSLAQDA